MSDPDEPTIETAILDVARTLHERMSYAAAKAQPLDPSLAIEIEDIKLELANRLTSIVLRIQMRQLERERPLQERAV